jgi:RimJ/RimL family protein N-acetyltransferase
MPELTLRERRSEDLPALHRWLHAEPQPDWQRWDAPYFHVNRPRSAVTLQEFTEQAHGKPPSPDQQVIALDSVCIGQVNRSEEAPVGGGWWELGLLIYDPAHWGGGLGTRALALWTDATFQETEAHVITLTTWSGNERMVRAAERVGYRECGRVPEARLWEDRRRDSVRLAVLRRDWLLPR